MSCLFITVSPVLKNIGLRFTWAMCCLFVASGLASASAQSYLDTVVFGNAGSEAGHSFIGINSAVITNTSVSPAQNGRCVLAATTNDVYGGWLTVTMTVDPVWRNYFTIKLWGADDISDYIGRLYLYVPMSNYVAGATNNYQVGYRHEGDYAPLSVAHWSQPLPGRFFYSTTLLPLWMTQGRTNLTLKIMASGRYYAFGTGGPPTGNCQFAMTMNSRGIYAAYTHTQPGFDPAGEVQGVKPPTSTRPTPGVSVLQSGGSYYNGAVSLLNNRLGRTVSTANLSPWDIEVLAHSYTITNLFTYTNPVVVAKVIAAIDCYATNYFADTNNGTGGWGGPYGWIGRAIAELQPQLESSFDVAQDYGAGGIITRRSAWGQMLKTSRDYGRFNRRMLSNQEFISNEQIYLANQGMLALNNPDAFLEEAAQRYLKESAGLVPWLGNDLPAGGSDAPFGTNYFQVTEKGQTREFGYLGCSYGEMELYVAHFYSYTGNPIFRDQLIKMIKARAPFRRPSMEVSGANYYRTMEGIGLLAWRGAAESDGDFAGQIAYGDRAAEYGGMRGAALSLDSDVVGYAKQMLADNQYFVSLGSPYDNLNVFQEYLIVANAPDSGKRLPMTDGQPDFAWADEDNGVIAAKHGNERLWLSTYWEAGWGCAVNGVGRFHYSTNDHDCYGTLQTSPQINFSGNFFVRGNMVDLPYKTGYWPPDNPVNAYTGERLPIGASDPSATDDSVFRGKAQFWAARYRNFLIGINRDYTKSYELKTPPGFISAVDLISGQMKSGTVMVAPRSTVVLYLDSPANNSPVPFAPLTLNAVADGTPKVTLDWSAASGALGYNVKRSLTKGGPYTTIANVTATNYTDTSVSFGVKYYYVVSGTNAFGESQYNSMEISATASDLQGWWKFDETTGTTAMDSGIGGKNGMLQSGASWVAGTISNAVQLNGTSSGFVDLPDGVVSTLNDFTISTWVKVNANTNWARLFDFGSGTSYYMFLTPQSGSSTIRYAIKNNGGEQQINGASVPSAGAWHHVAVTLSGTTGKMYVDGVAVGTNTSMTIRPSDLGNTWGNYIGESQFSADPCLNGSVDDFRIYNRALSATEITTLWNKTLPATPTGLAATPGNAQVALTWNAASGATRYNVKRATVNGGPYATITNVTSTSFTDSGLTSGTYYYVVSALNVVVESADSAPASATPTAAPAAPSGLTALAGDAQVGLNWNPVAGATGYIVRRATVIGGVFNSIATNATAIYTDTGLTNGMTYYYVVSALNAAGAGGNSASASATPMSLPAAPTILSVTASAGQASLSWSTISNATLYRVKRSLTSGGPYTTVTSVSGTNVLDLGLVNGLAYYYVVSAVNGNGESANSVQVSVTPADVPALVHRYSFNETSGTTVADSVGGAAWNGTLPNGGTFSGGKLTLASGSSQYAQLPAGILSNYTAVTIETWVTFPNQLPNACFFFGFGNVISNAGYNYIFCQPKNGRAAITDGSYSSEQNANTGVDFSYRTNLHLTFVFNPPGGTLAIYTNGVLAGINTGITIPMSSVNDVYNWIGRSLFSGDSYVGCTLDEFRIYNGALSDSQIAAAQALGANQLLPTNAPAVPTGLVATGTNMQVTLGWNAVSGATNYSLKWSLTNGSGYVTLTNLAGSSFVHTGLTNGTTYYYVVSALNVAGESAVSAQASATPLSPVPATPIGLTAVPGDSRVVLSWNASGGATGYNVKSSLTNGGAYALIGTNVGSLAFTNTGLVNGITYYYVVSAVNAGGESTNSVQVSVWPVSTNAPPLQLNINSGQLNLFWPAANRGWTLQTNSVGLSATNQWFACPGSSSLTNISVILNSSQLNVFFRLVYP